MQELTGAQALVRSLEQQGVEVVFGLPGGTILPTYDPLLSSSLRHILVRHEQGAGHAAEGYAWATGRPGVCMATSGPGATNLVTALSDAYMDSVPMVAITGQVGTSMIGTDAFQEADITGITLPITKHNEAGHRCGADPRGGRRGVPHRHDRPSPGPRNPHRRAKRRSAGHRTLVLAAGHGPARLPGAGATEPGRDPCRSRLAVAGPSAGAVRRRRGGQVRLARRAAPAG